MSRAAAIDLGSNTIKLTVAEPGAGGQLSVLYEQIEPTRIGERLDQNGYLLNAAMERSFKALSDFVAQAAKHGAGVPACVATAGMRGASNAQDFLQRAKEELGLEIEIIDGQREAELAYRAPAQAFGPGPLLVIDMGGRSTELVYGVGAELKDKVSLEMGAVRLTERFTPDDPPPPEQLRALAEHARAQLQAAPKVEDEPTLVGVSGTVMSLMGLSLGHEDLKQTLAEGEGGWLSREAIVSQLNRLAPLTAAERVQGSVLPPGRADVILAGCVVLLEVLGHYGAGRMRVTGRGVRYGLLAELMVQAQ